MNFEQVRAGLRECMAWVAAAPEEKREQVYLENLPEAVLSAREALMNLTLTAGKFSSRL